MKTIFRILPGFVVFLLGPLVPNTGAVELPFPVELIREEAAISDPPDESFGYPNHAAISGDVAVTTYMG